jgi:pyruvate/2-oxoglutarate dehydrogenase complex dihydrolipoamide acyltransferase (E2) component
MNTINPALGNTLVLGDTGRKLAVSGNWKLEGGQQTSQGMLFKAKDAEGRTMLALVGNDGKLVTEVQNAPDSPSTSMQQYAVGSSQTQVTQNQGFQLQSLLTEDPAPPPPTGTPGTNPVQEPPPASSTPPVTQPPPVTGAPPTQRGQSISLPQVRAKVNEAGTIINGLMNQQLTPEQTQQLQAALADPNTPEDMKRVSTAMLNRDYSDPRVLDYLGKQPGMGVLIDTNGVKDFIKARGDALPKEATEFPNEVRALQNASTIGQLTLALDALEQAKKK